MTTACVEKGVPNMIALNDIYCSFQGEGVNTGTPMVIVRLQGCGVGCPWCDTKETWVTDDEERVAEIGEAVKQRTKWTSAMPREIARRARKIGPYLRWAMITGGEPAEQPLFWLVQELHDEKFKVALETSGTASGFVDCGFDWICISPKLDMPGGKTFDPYLLRYADEVKHVVVTQKDIDWLDYFVANVAMKADCVISLQPVSKNEKTTKLCLSACLERGWNLSIQTHRYINAR
jgi:7-carboxy-7-deazaguanine synthase